MKTRLFLGVGLAGILGLAAAGCTNVEGENEAPVTITVSLEEQPGFINVGSAAPIQISEIQLQSNLKNPNATDPQGFATTQVNSYQVRYRRTDGGTRVPPMKTFGCGIVIEAGGNATLNNFPILAGSDLQEAPFDQLFPFNGGIDRETGRAEIQMAFDITFFGRTVSGHRVQSQTASGLLLFVFAGSEPLSRN
ncbi:MAG TPA: hypothetical protein VIB08_11815 [Thermoanaerobaculia bacterium]|jgi:hypothetical protein